MKEKITAKEVIEKLNLLPLPVEGGMFRSTYRNDVLIDGRNASSAIYYMLSNGAFSHLHILDHDEMYHFYLGDPLEMMLIYPDGTAEVKILGNNLLKGEEPQILIEKGVVQGSRSVGPEYFSDVEKEMYGFSLVGTTNSPGYEDESYTHFTDVADIISRYPEFEELLLLLGQ